MTPILVYALVLAGLLTLLWWKHRQFLNTPAPPTKYRLIVRGESGEVFGPYTMDAMSYAHALKITQTLFGDKAEVLCDGERE